MFDVVVFFVVIVFSLVALCEGRTLKVTNNSTSGGFVKRKGTEFVVRDYKNKNKSPFFFNGFNSYWMMHIASESTHRYKVSNVFREASSVGLSVCRTWAFSDGGNQSLQISPGIYNDHVFQVIIVY